MDLVGGQHLRDGLEGWARFKVLSTEMLPIPDENNTVRFIL